MGKKISVGYYSFSDDDKNGFSVTVIKETEYSLMLDACQTTSNREFTPKDMNLFARRIYRAMHSPIRTQVFTVLLENIPTYVSVHLVRHHEGVTHFVRSRRSDNTGVPDEQVTRMTPVDHRMFINAEALVNMAHSRLCGKADWRTRCVMKAIKEQIGCVDSVLSEFMVRKCEYIGRCDEIKPCGNR